MSIEKIAQGTITSPKGFRAGAIYAGIKTAGEGRLDLGILYSETPCTAAAVFTTNQVKAAPVIVSKAHLAGGKPRAVVVNAGCANACTGAQGLQDAKDMAAVTAHKLGLHPSDVLVASTGVIGVHLPMTKIKEGIRKISESPEGGPDLARAITTTDTFAKEVALSVRSGGVGFSIGGIAKGAGMIHPDMATLLVFLSTDAAVEQEFLDDALRQAANASFNMTTIDGDMSTNDTMVLFANGMAGNKPISRSTPEADTFTAALTDACVSLAKMVARDGEGANTLIEVVVEGAESLKDARLAARTIAGSSLVKSAVHGHDPNWGRILAALGRSGAVMLENRTDVYLGDVCLMKEGTPQPYDRTVAARHLAADPVLIRVFLRMGTHAATAWGCDLSEEYVTFNSAYTT